MSVTIPHVAPAICAREAQRLTRSQTVTTAGSESQDLDWDLRLGHSLNLKEPKKTWKGCSVTVCWHVRSNFCEICLLSVWFICRPSLKCSLGKKTPLWWLWIHEPTNNWHAHQVQSQDDYVTRPPFRQQLYFGDRIMAKCHQTLIVEEHTIPIFLFLPMVNTSLVNQLDDAKLWKRITQTHIFS